MTGPARLLPSRDYDRLKSASRFLVEKAGGPAHLSRILGRISGKGTISKYGSVREEHQGTFAPLDVVADLEAETGLPEITRALAELSGYVLVRVPEADPGAPDWMQMFARLLAAENEVKTGLLSAIKAAEFAPAEAATLRTAALRLMEILGEVGVACQAVIDGRDESPR